MELEQIVKGKIRGAILIKHEEKELLCDAFGYADHANEISNQRETRFATASGGKVFVAVGILQLIEKGLLRFDSKLKDVIPLDWKQIDTNITVHQLLTHTSGIPDYFDESVMEQYEDLWHDFPNYRVRANKDLLPLFIDKPMMYEKGTKFQYNNTGYVVLAMIIEEIMHVSFDEYLHKHVFLPCGMTSTGYYELDRLPARCASNYIEDKATNSYRTNIYSVDAKGTGAGGAFTTIDDIALFWRGLLTHKLLSKHMVEAMLDNQCGDFGNYGYGVWLAKTDHGFVPYFQGSDPGVSFLTSFDTQKDVMAVYISNYGDSVWELNREVNAWLKTANL